MREASSMSLTHPLDRLRVRLVVVAIGLGCILSLGGVAIVHGWRFTIAWVLGSESLGVAGLQIASTWWLLAGFALWFGAQFLMSRLHCEPPLRVAAWLAGPVVATVALFQWTTSLIFYTWGVWPANNYPSGLRWVLDGPVMAAWYRACNSMLWTIRVPGPVEPIHFVDGSSVAHIHGTVIVLGVLNGAMLVLVLATIATLLLASFRRAVLRGTQAA